MLDFGLSTNNNKYIDISSLSPVTREGLCGQSIELESKVRFAPLLKALLSLLHAVFIRIVTVHPNKLLTEVLWHETRPL